MYLLCPGRIRGEHDVRNGEICERILMRTIAGAVIAIPLDSETQAREDTDLILCPRCATLIELQRHALQAVA